MASSEPGVSTNVPIDPVPDATNQSEQELPMAAKASETAQPIETAQTAEVTQPAPATETTQPVASQELAGE